MILNNYLNNNNNNNNNKIIKERRWRREEERKRKNEKQNNLIQLKRVKLRQAGARCPKLLHIIAQPRKFFPQKFNFQQSTKV